MDVVKKLIAMAVVLAIVILLYHWIMGDADEKMPGESMEGFPFAPDEHIRRAEQARDRALRAQARAEEAMRAEEMAEAGLSPGEVVEKPAQPVVAPTDEAATAEETEATTPTPVPTPPAAPSKVYPYTNQQVINAFYAVFTERGERERFWEYVVLAGLAHLAEHRSERFRGPDIQDLPNLDDDMKAALLKILGG